MLTSQPQPQTFAELEQISSTAKPSGPGKYAQESSSAKAMFETLFNSTKWQVESDGLLKVSKLTFDDLQYPFIRGDMLFKNETTSRVCSIVRNTHSRTEWDARFEASGFKVIENINHGLAIVNAVQKGSFPVSGRDVVLLSDCTAVGDQVDSLASSIVHPNAPETMGKVRAESLTASWRLIQCGTDVKVTYIAHANPKGNVPSWLFKLLLSEITQCVPNVEKYLKSKGPNPTQLFVEGFKAGDDCTWTTIDFEVMGFRGDLLITESEKVEKGVVYIALPPKMTGKCEFKIEGGEPRVVLVPGCEKVVGDMQVVKIYNSKPGALKISCNLGKKNSLNGVPF